MLIPSPGETTPSTLIEALLNRCPVIADHSGYAEEYRPPEYLPKKLESAYLVEKLQYALRACTVCGMFFLQRSNALQPN